MHEVGVEVCGGSGFGEALCEGFDLGGRVAASAAQTVAAEAGCVDVGCDEIVAFSDAECGVVATKDIVGGVGEPAGVTEFEGELEAGLLGEGWVFEECVQTCVVGGEVRRELEEYGAEFFGCLRRCDRG